MKNFISLAAILAIFIGAQLLLSRGWMPWQVLWQRWESSKLHQEAAREQEFNKQKAIVDDVRHLDSACTLSETLSSLEVHGKVLVWDIRGGKDTQPLSAHGMIDDANVYLAEDDGTDDVNSAVPRRLRASSSDRPITVFMIFRTRVKKAGEYQASSTLAYRRYADIAVAYWPERRLAGCTSVLSEPPSEKRRSDSKEYYPDLNQPIVNWIVSLPWKP